MDNLISRQDAIDEIEYWFGIDASEALGRLPSAQPETIWRVEDRFEGHGLWRNADGTPADTFDKLTIGKCRNMPMDDSEFYRYDGKQWFSACDSPDELKHWFDVLDIVQLRNIGHMVFMFEVKKVRKVSEYEVVFTRDDIIRRIQIDPASIWEDFDEASAQPERQGKWIPENIVLTSNPPQYKWHCSECGRMVHWFTAEVLTDYCPNCGADMRGEDHEQHSRR